MNNSILIFLSEELKWQGIEQDFAHSIEDKIEANRKSVQVQCVLSQPIGTENINQILIQQDFQKSPRLA